MKAGFASRCAKTGDRIEVGQDITRTGTGQWRHVACPGRSIRSRVNSETLAHEAVAMQWAMDRFGPEGVYADGEHDERQARSFAVREYDRHMASLERRAATTPDPVESWATWKGLHSMTEREQEAAAFLSDPDYVEFSRGLGEIDGGGE